MKSLPDKIDQASRNSSVRIDGLIVQARPSSSFDSPVSGGLCLPRGRMQDCRGVRIELPANAERRSSLFEGEAIVLDRWSDGSVRWVLANAVTADSTGRNSELLKTYAEQRTSVEGSVFRRLPVSIELNSDPPTSPNCRTQVRTSDNRIELTSVNWTRDLPRERRLWIEPRMVSTSSAAITAADSAAEIPVKLIIGSVQQESVSDVRQVFVIPVAVSEAPFIELQLRLICWPQTGHLEIESRIRNTRRARHNGGLWDLGDPGSWFFRGFELRLTSPTIASSGDVRWKPELDLPWRIDACSTGIFVSQTGSGGPWWTSHNHPTTPADRGYVAKTAAGFLRGYRAEPTVIIGDDSESLAVGLPEFWQNFPGRLGVDSESVICELFSSIDEAQHELQGGEQKTRTVRCLFLNEAERQGQGLDEAVTWLHTSNQLLPADAAVKAAQAIAWYPGHPGEVSGGVSLCEYLQAAMSGDFSIDERRNRIDEYGWRNFGDVPADHEQTHYSGSNTVVSHYNNQFDLIFGGIQNWLASGDPAWHQLFSPLARHVMDIDVYHTTEDRAVFNGGLFWHTDHYVDAATSSHRTYSAQNQKPGQPYGGGPGNEHNYTTGLLYCYWLTGHPEPRETVLSLANWVIAMDDGRRTVLGVLDDGPTGFASATVSPDFHGPGRGAGNSINALLDAWLLTRESRYLYKAEELIRRCVHPKQNLDELHLSDAEGHWSYTVFLTSLGRYLTLKLEADQQDQMYSYSRAVMEHYGRWMVQHEFPTLSRPEALQYPTEAWAAQDFRKANVLRLAAQCTADPGAAEQMRQKAHEINAAAWQSLNSFGSARLTARCLSILLTEGLREVYHRSHCTESLPTGPQYHGPESWRMFIPQKTRVRSLLKSPAKLAMRMLKVLSPQRCIAALDALRRQI